jgi:hypothetical protein
MSHYLRKNQQIFLSLAYMSALTRLSGGESGGTADTRETSATTATAEHKADSETLVDLGSPSSSRISSCALLQSASWVQCVPSDSY